MESTTSSIQPRSLDTFQRLRSFASADPAAQTDAVVAAWLHDVIEDTGETAESLRDVGVSPAPLSAVERLTRTAATEGDRYYLAIKDDPVALMVKTADLASNLDPRRTAQLPEEVQHRLQVKYDHAMNLLGVSAAEIAALHA